MSIRKPAGLFCTGSRVALAAFSALFSLWLAGCGNLVDMGGNRSADPRRAYVNDPARNDSLATALPGRGVQFVLQPGKQYALRMKTQATGQVLNFYAPSGSVFKYQGSIEGVRQGDVVSYLLSPTQASADVYLGFLSTESGARTSAPDSAVRLVPLDTSGSTSVAVRLLMVRQLTGLPNATAKSLYARAFNEKLKSLYAAFGITLDTSTVVVEPDGDPFTVTFAGGAVSIPGERRADAINLYLVDDIGDGDAEGTILGFAPREAFDLSDDIESRVILNVRGYSGSGAAEALAVTAAHEMGHFLGLRHTSATTVDRGFDDDDSNRDDGFASTPYCSSLEKRAAGGPAEVIRVRSGRAFCLRVAGTAYTCACSDAPNLMYPYACEAYPQETLGLDQQSFIRNNLKLFQ
jgi:hypothetical protein